jgi:hypothetical protein
LKFLDQIRKVNGHEFIIKTNISKLVHRTGFWNNLHHVRSKSTPLLVIGDLILFRSFVFITPKTLNYLAFHFDFERTWWRLFQKPVRCTNFDIFVFIINSWPFTFLIWSRNFNETCRVINTKDLNRIRSPITKRGEP